MRTIIALITSILFSTVSIAQIDKEKEIERSNIEKFSNRSGVLIQKEFEDIGSIKKCQVQIAVFTDLISNQVTKGVRFEYEYKNSYTSDTKLALLDEDEISSFITSLTLIKEKVLPSSPTNYTEVSYKSRSGFEGGCFKSKNSWSIYIKLEKYDSNSYVFMDQQDIDTLLDLMKLAKSKL